MKTPPALRGCPLWTQGRVLERGCATFLRHARPALSGRDWELLADHTWLIREQIAQAVSPSEDSSVRDGLEMARATVAEIQVLISNLIDEPALLSWHEHLLELRGLAAGCEAQLRTWLQQVGDRVSHGTTDGHRATNDSDAAWNEAFAKLIQLSTPPSPRRGVAVSDGPTTKQ